MDLEVQFANPQQREAFYATQRNQCFSGGFNNGKSYAECLKIYTLLTTFPKYRAVICRQVRADLMKTTYQTFYKICPKEFIKTQNLQEGFTIFQNDSRVDWLHMDGIEESTLRGLEINSYFWDQAEEGEEKVFDILNARLGRWDQVDVPKWLLDTNPNWPKNSLTGKYRVPEYGLLACNPDTQYHWIYRKFHPDSLERLPNHFFIEGEWDPKLGSQESYDQVLSKDEEFVAKYVRGKWGISTAQIHRIFPESFLEYSPELIDLIKRKGNLFRILDHGDTAPTCCLWCAAIGGCYIFYREYYAPNQLISYHRQAIHDLSDGERFSGNYADPSIFRKESQNNGGFWTVADEYTTKSITGPPLCWTPADNNEFATRNRINEFLRPNTLGKHPITGKEGNPRIYFIKRSDDWRNGCYHSINQLGSQRRKLIGYIDGKAIYSDDREDSVADHAYDCVRYMMSMHGSGLAERSKTPPRFSMKYYQMMKNRHIGRTIPA